MTLTPKIKWLIIVFIFAFIIGVSIYVYSKNKRKSDIAADKAARKKAAAEKTAQSIKIDTSSPSSNGGGVGKDSNSYRPANKSANKKA